jgi:soluble lytic murein transglycosylase
MPPTARMVARRHKVRGYSWADMDQPELNLRIGSLYLGGLLKRWKGVLPLAVGSYNAGPGAMSRMRKKRPNLALDVWVEEISIRQTREYVQRVLASAWTYAQLYPELGGLDLNMMGMR